MLKFRPQRLAAFISTRPTAGRALYTNPPLAMRGETPEERASRKEAQKAAKAARRAQREGRIAADDPDFGRKPCTLCGQPKDLLIRCQVDESQRWHMVCGKCWKDVSGGVVDGDASHPHYRYGGLWKNLHKQ